MHITLETDYAVRIVYCLAKESTRMDAKSISEKAQVTLRFALKILHKLVTAGIVKSFKGAQGGYEIAKPLEELTLKEVIETVEGPYHFSRCVGNHGQCNRIYDGSDFPCKFYGIFEEISLMVQKKLEAVKFSDLIE